MSCEQRVCSVADNSASVLCPKARLISDCSGVCALRIARLLCCRQQHVCSAIALAEGGGSEFMIDGN